ncbi:MAG: TetR/AcrR family transcriptional regulator [Polyangiaceae bacterium]
MVEAATLLFNGVGYFATDSNQIAREAGYAPASFYKHFPDKKTVFLSVYELFVSEVKQSVEQALSLPVPEEAASQLVHGLIQLHQRWRVFRASLRALVAMEPDIRQAHWAYRHDQLSWISSLNRSAPPSSSVAKNKASSAAARAEAAELMFLLERVCDAIADGEAEQLGLDHHQLTETLISRVKARITPTKLQAVTSHSI